MEAGFDEAAAGLMPLQSPICDLIGAGVEGTGRLQL